jgi:hypothetical protein
MKPKTFLLLCLFMGIGLMQLSAQSEKKDGNHAVAYWWNEQIGYFPLVCSDVAPKFVGDPDFEWLTATVNIHVVEKWKNGQLNSIIWKVNWEPATSSWGEVFNVNEKDILSPEYYQDGEKLATDYWYANIIGNLGHQYHLCIKVDWTYRGPGPDDWDAAFTVIKAECR